MDWFYGCSGSSNDGIDGTLLVTQERVVARLHRHRRRRDTLGKERKVSAH